MNINDYKNRSCFTTPDNYFEKLNIGIKEATCKSAATNSKKANLTQRIVRIMSFAAMIAIVATVATNIILNNHQSNSNLSFNGIDDSEFIDNMLNNYPIDEYTFYCYLTGCE